MTEIIVCMAVIMGSVAVYLAFIRLFLKDDKRIVSKPYIMYISITVMALADITLACIYKVTVQYFVFCILALYLDLTAYIDSQTMNVYRLSNIIFGSLGICIIIFLRIDIRSQYIGALIYLAFIVLISCTGGMGKGDAFTLITIMPYMMLLNLGNDFLMVMFFNTVIFMVLFIFINIRKLDIRKMKLKSKSPLTPAIAFSTMIIVIVAGLIRNNI